MIKEIFTDEQIAELLSIIKNRYGYDFANYSEASLIRRITRFREVTKTFDFFELKNRLLNDAAYFADFVIEITVNVTEMFRDPSFFKALREKVFPYLETYPFYKVWNAGCSTGEEVYSTAILLHEKKILDRARIYATDINSKVLASAREGIFPLKHMQDYSSNYQKAGGEFSLSDYYVAQYGLAKFDSQLPKNMMFSVHNLVSDGSFNEFNLIVCRNVMIYFNRKLQERVFRLFYESMPVYGFLALGSKETLQFSGVYECFEVVDAKEKIYRKIY